MVQGCNPEGSNRVCQACFKPSRASWSSTNGCTYDCNPGSYVDANAPITVTRLHPNSLQNHPAVSISGDGKVIFLGHGRHAKSWNGGALRKVDENGMLSDYYSSNEIWRDARANHNGSRVMAHSMIQTSNTGHDYTLRSLKNGIQQDSHFYNTPNGQNEYIAVGTSIDGQHLYYYLQGKVYYSSNAMASSTEVAASANDVLGICVSSDGKVAWTTTHLVAQEVSPSGTGSKSKTISSNQFVAIACSADVSTIVLTTQTNVIYTSSDGGLSFVATGKDLQFDKTNPFPLPHQQFQSNFSNCNTANDCDGWDCGGATQCGLVTDPTPGFGSICGGYGKKGKGQHIQRRIDSLTKKATYTFSLDVIIGDSWDGESLIIEVAPVVGSNPGTWETCYEERFAFKWNVYPTNDKPNHKTGRNICKYNTIIFLPLMSHIQIY